MSSGILAFSTCRACVTAGRRPRIHAGLIDAQTLRLWCATCDRLIVDYDLAEPQPLRCDVCGKPAEKGHVH